MVQARAADAAQDKAVAVVWDKVAVVGKAMVAGKEADEVWVVEGDAVWGAVAAPLVQVVSVSVQIVVRLFHISKVYLALNKTAQSVARR